MITARVGLSLQLLLQIFECVTYLGLVTLLCRHKGYCDLVPQDIRLTILPHDTKTLHNEFRSQCKFR